MAAMAAPVLCMALVIALAATVAPVGEAAVVKHTFVVSKSTQIVFFLRKINCVTFA
jgi:hypothetical protein